MKKLFAAIQKNNKEGEPFERNHDQTIFCTAMEM
jgi:hypothetical protein